MSMNKLQIIQLCIMNKAKERRGRRERKSHVPVVHNLEKSLTQQQAAGRSFQKQWRTMH